MGKRTGYGDRGKSRLAAEGFGNAGCTLHPVGRNAIAGCCVLPGHKPPDQANLCICTRWLQHPAAANCPLQPGQPGTRDSTRGCVRRIARIARGGCQLAKVAEPSSDRRDTPRSQAQVKDSRGIPGQRKGGCKDGKNWEALGGKPPKSRLNVHRATWACSRDPTYRKLVSVCFRASAQPSSNRAYQMSFSDPGSWTIRLSRGERPVLVPE